MSNYPDVDLPEEPDAEADARNDEDPRADQVAEIVERFARNHEVAVRLAGEALENITTIAQTHRDFTTADMDLMSPTLRRLKELANG